MPPAGKDAAKDKQSKSKSQEKDKKKGGKTQDVAQPQIETSTVLQAHAGTVGDADVAMSRAPDPPSSVEGAPESHEVEKANGKGNGKGDGKGDGKKRKEKASDTPQASAADAEQSDGDDGKGAKGSKGKGKGKGRSGKQKADATSDASLDSAMTVVPAELRDAERALPLTPSEDAGSDMVVNGELGTSTQGDASNKGSDAASMESIDNAGAADAVSASDVPEMSDLVAVDDAAALQSAGQAAARAAEEAAELAARTAAGDEGAVERDGRIVSDADAIAASAAAAHALGGDDADSVHVVVEPLQADDTGEHFNVQVLDTTNATPPSSTADAGGETAWTASTPTSVAAPPDVPPMADPASIVATVGGDSDTAGSGAETASASLISHDDIYLFNEGRHQQLYDRLGAHRQMRDGVAGWHFAVWAPNATRVAVMGDFNGWNADAHHLQPFLSSGVWTGFVPGAEAGQVYKYVITSHSGERLEKADPFATRAELPPRTGSVLWELDYVWNDSDWMTQRGWHNAADAPMSIYEVHLGSWRHRAEEGDRWLTYRELAGPLADHVTTMGFTHVEFLPVMEHPFYGSWGYQGTGYFAPTSRYGTPQDFMYLVDVLHQRGIGVILDWVPSHFPDDPHGLYRFDGTHLFEHADPRQGFHPDWGSMIFNYGRNEVRSFLTSSAIYWLERFHIDGIRVDAVASMLYLDYSRKAGEWIPNQFGGRENLEAVDFLRQLNTDIYARFPDVQVIAEESTAWPGVSRPVYTGGLGFGMKWDMGWMHDTLLYFSRDPIHRRYHHNELTFRMVYAYDENFVLPFSHDEVVHGKGSMLGRMVGDDWQQFANLRLLYTYMYTMPGKKLLFMGSEFGTRSEWNHEASLDWEESRTDAHRGIAHLVGDLNRLLRAEPALQRLDFSPEGFTWLESTDADASVLAYMRNSGTPGEDVVCVFNLTPVPRYGYRVGVPQEGYWREVSNSDAGVYWGSGVGNLGGVHSEPTPWHGQPHSVPLTLPPLGALVLRRAG